MNKKKAFIALGATTAAAGTAAAAYFGSMFHLFSGKKSLVYQHMNKGQSSHRQAVEPLLEEIRELPMEEAEIQSFDGLRLHGRWYPAQEAKATMLLVHGWRSSYDNDFAPMVSYLHDMGCNLLLIDQRSHGESQGKLISYGLLERFDVQSWVEYALQRAGDLPIFLYGVSMGATTVLMASGLPLDQQVKGIIADCGFTSADESIKSVLKRDGIAVEPAFTVANRLFRSKTGYNYHDYSTLDAMEDNTLPVLFIHGSADKLVPCSMTIECYNACKAPKELLIIPDAGHAMSVFKDPETYHKALKGFVEKYI